MYRAEYRKLSSGAGFCYVVAPDGDTVGPMSARSSFGV